MKQERIDGPTLHGGVYAIIYYQGANGEAVDKERAVKAEIVEFDANDNQVWRTYMKIENNAG